MTVFVLFVAAFALLLRSVTILLSSSCIDLIFSSQPNLLIESGIYLSLHASCHHQITFAKFNLDIAYQPPYERENWHYQKVNIDLIKRAINAFD